MIGLYLPGGVRNLLRPVADERGQAFVEYVLLLLVIAVSVFAVAVWTGLGTTLTTAVTNVSDAITSVSGG